MQYKSNNLNMDNPKIPKVWIFKVTDKNYKIENKKQKSNHAPSSRNSSLGVDNQIFTWFSASIVAFVTRKMAPTSSTNAGGKKEKRMHLTHSVTDKQKWLSDWKVARIERKLWRTLTLVLLQFQTLWWPSQSYKSLWQMDNRWWKETLKNEEVKEQCLVGLFPPLAASFAENK